MMRSALVLATLVTALGTGCTHGYMKASDLSDKKQGPEDCEDRCHELGMRMGALVLVSDQLPACVCEPLQAPRSKIESNASSGASGGYVVIAAAAAAARQQQVQQQQQQQSFVPH